MDRRRVLELLAAGRIGLGAALVLVPDRIAPRWIGADAVRPGPRLLARSLGARDVGLGVGALWALRAGDAARVWLAAGAMADAVDALATAIAGRALPSGGRNGTLVLAAGSALAAVALGRGVT